MLDTNLHKLIFTQTVYFVCVHNTQEWIIHELNEYEEQMWVWTYDYNMICNYIVLYMHMNIQVLTIRNAFKRHMLVWPTTMGSLEVICDTIEQYDSIHMNK
jgi:hypothetical protein